MRSCTLKKSATLHVANFVLGFITASFKNLLLVITCLTCTFSDFRLAFNSFYRDDLKPFRVGQTKKLCTFLDDSAGAKRTIFARNVQFLFLNS